jgi:hypothetical protein
MKAHNKKGRRKKRKTKYSLWQKGARAIPRVLIFLFLSFFLMVIVLLGTKNYFFDLGENERLAMLSALAGVAFYMAFRTIDNPDWSLKNQFITSVRYIVYFMVFFIGLNFILLLLQFITESF